MGFHPAWKYEEVHELIFHKGKLKEKKDLSNIMAHVRDELSNTPLKSGIDESRISEWIESTFSLDYNHLI